MNTWPVHSWTEDMQAWPPSCKKNLIPHLVRHHLIIPRKVKLLDKMIEKFVDFQNRTHYQIKSFMQDHVPWTAKHHMWSWHTSPKALYTTMSQESQGSDGSVCMTRTVEEQLWALYRRHVCPCQVGLFWMRGRIPRQLIYWPVRAREDPMSAHVCACQSKSGSYRPLCRFHSIAWERSGWNYCVDEDRRRVSCVLPIRFHRRHSPLARPAHISNHNLTCLNTCISLITIWHNATHSIRVCDCHGTDSSQPNAIRASSFSEWWSKRHCDRNMKKWRKRTVSQPENSASAHKNTRLTMSTHHKSCGCTMLDHHSQRCARALWLELRSSAQKSAL